MIIYHLSRNQIKTVESEEPLTIAIPLDYQCQPSSFHDSHGEIDKEKLFSLFEDLLGNYDLHDGDEVELGKVWCHMVNRPDQVIRNIARAMGQIIVPQPNDHRPLYQIDVAILGINGWADRPTWPSGPAQYLKDGQRPEDRRSIYQTQNDQHFAAKLNRRRVPR